MEIKSGRFYIDINDPEFVQFRDGSGPRVFRKTILVGLPYGGGVAAHASIAHINIDNNAVARLDVGTENVTTKSFDVVISTWADTRIYGVAVTWIAHTLD
ncbi:H-type lectin domain-containing protein [Sorangium sp. So ce124]|uniref:H-type lectin domain-containing protein n=1 Tax=Sorangium sp. So ce124 TaxID=3133280 RepID=UPI003F5D5F0A